MIIRESPPSYFDYVKEFKKLKPYRASCEMYGQPKHLGVHYTLDFREKLMSFNEMKDGTMAMGRSNEPSGCKGIPSWMLPTKHRKHKGKFLCGKPWVCLHCWHVQAQRSGVRGFRRFHGLDGVQRVSVNLHGVDAKGANQARLVVRDMLKDAGAECIWLNVHITGDTPTEGLKFGVDGLYWGEKARRRWDSPAILEPLNDYQMRDDRIVTGKRFYTRVLGKQPKHLWLPSAYSGRCTYDVRRLLAGQFMNDGYPSVMTFGMAKADSSRFMKPFPLRWGEWRNLHEEVVEAYRLTRRAVSVGPVTQGRRADGAAANTITESYPLPMGFVGEFPDVPWVGS